MSIVNITGGVSPIKARQKHRGGKHAGAATATGKQRGGFGKSTGRRGAGGRNAGGYNVQTRFRRGAWVPPGHQKVDKRDASRYPTEMTIPEIKDDPNATLEHFPGIEGTDDIYETITTEVLKDDSITVAQPGQKYTWDQAWDSNLENIRNKYPNKDAYKDDMRNIQEGKYKGASAEDIHKSIYETKTENKLVKKGTEGKDEYWVLTKSDGSTVRFDNESDANTALADANKSPNKYKFGGYRFGKTYGVGKNK